MQFKVIFVIEYFNLIILITFITFIIHYFILFLLIFQLSMLILVRLSRILLKLNPFLKPFEIKHMKH